MEEEKAAAYYDELTRNGGGAARFKHGLGFSGRGSGSSPPPPSRGSLLPSSSLFSNFVKASSPKQSSKLEKQAQLESIQNKLKKKTKEERRRPSPSPPPRHRSRSRDRDGERRSRGRRSRSRSRERYRERDSRRRGRRSRSRSRSASPRRGRRSNRRSRNSSPRERRRSEKRRSDDAERERARNDQNGSKGVDYSTSIQGYDKMTPAEKVKARMKLQLDETAKNDTERSMGKGWERFEFNMDAPLDDEEIEAGEDDAALVKHIGKSFRYSAVEARREEQIRAAHDEAMFGAPAFPPSITLESEPEGENDEKGSTENHVATTLVSEKVLAKQQGSWRDRVRNV